MCGIVGFLGSDEAAPILLESLRRMEYRGYDSAGIATLQDGKLLRRRAVGKLAELSNLLVRDPIRGLTGIGHTRWATHGQVTLANAHPHNAATVSVVHNGIIENHRELRDRLAKQGIAHRTDTDTESIALLCQFNVDKGMQPREAALQTVRSLDGAFALVFMFEGHEDCLIAARQGSPLVIGHGRSEMFLASDTIALAGLADRITYLEDGDFACVSRNCLSLTDRQGRPVSRPQERNTIDPASVDKGGHKHFMAKEIYEQPKVLSSAIGRLVTADQSAAHRNALTDIAECGRIEIVGCGTANFACQVAGYWFERLAGIPSSSTLASEFCYRNGSLDGQVLGIFVSQSGETADTLVALRHMKNQGRKTLAVLNVMTSSAAREADAAIPIHAGVEIGVASTKAFTCQLIALASLAIAAGRRRGTVSEAEHRRLLNDLQRLPALASAALNSDSQIQKIAREIARSSSVLFIGRGTMFPMALEGALKLKEISYIHAEGLASGELKHGPLALVDDGFPVVVLAPRDELFDKTLSSSEEVMARNGKILLISDADGIRAAGSNIWRSVSVPAVDPVFAPILYALPLQLIAYHTAVHLGTDVDQPRNLAKSVTVE